MIRVLVVLLLVGCGGPVDKGEPVSGADVGNDTAHVSAPDMADDADADDAQLGFGECSRHADCSGMINHMCALGACLHINQIDELCLLDQCPSPCELIADDEDAYAVICPGV